jgi:hypothetical protein
VAEDGELLTEGEIFQSQLRSASEEGTEEQMNDSEEGVSPGQTLNPSKESADGIFRRDKGHIDSASIVEHPGAENEVEAATRSLRQSQVDRLGLTGSRISA